MSWQIIVVIYFPTDVEADQEKILALLASWSFHRKPTAQRGNFSIEKVLSITKKTGSKSSLSVLK